MKQNIDLSKGIDDVYNCLCALESKELRSAIFECNRDAFRELTVLFSSDTMSMMDPEDGCFTLLGIPVVVTDFDGLRLVV